jgi:hypothetical protein
VHFALLSFNCRGYNRFKTPFIKSFMSDAAVVFLQEHWLSVDQMPMLGDIDSNFLYTGVTGFDNSDVLLGRPFGGCAILWRSDLLGNVSVLPTDSRRICAVCITNDVYRFFC